ncbi:MAG: VWA domain-containing protein [Saprospiraceae bacterium]|nr:VWA domain-containing protein [Saprospiraceae bacterium]
MFQFQFPEYLWLFIAAPLTLTLLSAYFYWRRRTVQQLGDTRRVMPGFSENRFRLKGALLVFAILLLTISWANPQKGEKKQTLTREAADVFIALDISQSMLCRDVAPNRLELAKIFAQKVVQSLEGERIGLIFFAGNAFLAVPLSTDYNFLMQSLQGANTDMLTEQGTEIGQAFELAEKSFEAEPGGGRAIVLITDGENHDEEAVEAAENAYENGTVVMAIGAGTSQGGPIPVGEWEGGQYKRDEKGEVVRTQLNETLLKKIAAAGHSLQFNLSQGDRAITAIKNEVDGLEKRALEVRSNAEKASWYAWFLLPALLLLALEPMINLQKTAAQ